MLFGKVIFIKKGGGDGSKYPVKEKSVLIGNSEKCSIRIHNSQIAPKHCQLIADDKGQVKLRNFSEVTYLNDKPLNQEDVTLCHGDILKIGDRLARWEYFPSSKYYRQLLSPSGRLVAVVMPQQRSQVSTATPGTSAGQISPKNTTLGTKRRYSEKIILEGGSAKKFLKATNENKMPDGMKNMAKIISGRHSFHTAKMLFSPKVKMRKSTSSINSSKTSVVNAEKKSKPSLLPWKVNPISPPLVKKAGQRKSTPIKKSTPLRLSKAVRNSSLVRNLNTIEESPSNESKDTMRVTRSSSKSPKGEQPLTELSTPKRKSSSGKVKLINSESKLNSQKNTSFKKFSHVKRLSLSTKFEQTSKKSPAKKVGANSTKKSASTSKVRYENVKKNSNIKLKNLDLKSLTEAPVTDVKSSRSSPRKKQNITSETSVSSPSKSRKSVEKKPQISSVTTSTGILPSKQSKTSPSKEIKKSVSKSDEKKKLKGARRKRSPVITSAEKAAKKLKISTPSKPDKNKKAALLVLGKANKKHLLAQNVKVLLKQKIIKKAIKQSTAPPVKKDLKTEPVSSKQKPLRNSTNQKKTNSTKVLKASKLKKSFNKAVSQTSDAEAKKLNSRVSDIKKFDFFEEISKEFKNSETASSSSSITSAKMTTPKSLKISLPDASSESSKKSISINTSSANTNEISTTFAKSPESYIFSSSRRCSKRLSSKNDVSKPDFMELSPTALGLIPKTAEIFKTPKQIRGRRSISLVTPKNNCLSGIVKSTSTSKLGQKKMVRFSPRDFFDKSRNFGETAHSSSFDFENIHTPNITLEVFVSPLTQKTTDRYSNSSSNYRKRKLSEIALKNNSLITDSINENLKTIGNESKSLKCARKLLQSPQLEDKISSPMKTPLKTNKTDKSLELFNLSESSEIISPTFKNILQSRISTNSRNSVINLEKSMKSPTKSKNITNEIKITSQVLMSPKNNREKDDLNRISELAIVPSPRKSLRSSLNNSSLNLSKEKISEKLDFSDTEDANQFSRTSESKKRSSSDLLLAEIKSPKGSKRRKIDLNDVEKVKTPRVQKGPKNELNDLRGVKELFSEKARKSPKNDLTDVAGVKRLLRTPKENKSPKNDLSDVAGVKQLLKTPRVQKSPKNELNDLRGVKQLFTQKTRKSPKNDLSDVTGVKKLLKTPRVQKSPKNDLTDVAGVKRLLKTPKENKSPKNELNDLRGVKQLFTQKHRKSPKNDLSNISGVKQLLKTPRVQKSPKNELNDLRGVKELFTQKTRKSPKNDLTDVAGVKRLLSTPKGKKSPKNDLSDITGVKQLLKTPRVQKSPKNDLTDVAGVKRLLKTPKENKSPKNELNDLRGVKQLFTQKTRKSPKNDLTDVTGVKQLMRTPRLAKSPRNDLSDVDGVKELLRSPGQLKHGFEENVGDSYGTLHLQTTVTEGTEVKQLLITKNTTLKVSTRNKAQSYVRRFPISDFRQIKGRRTIYSTTNNYSANVKETQQLVKKIKPTRDWNISLTGVAELFNFLPVDSETKKSEDGVRSTRKKVVTSIPTESKISIITREETTSKRGRPRERAASPNLRKSVRKKKEISVESKTAEKKRKADKSLTTESSKASKTVEERGRKRRLKFETPDSTGGSKTRNKTRSRSVSDNAEPSPPKKTRRKQTEEAVTEDVATEGKTKRAISKKKVTSSSKKKTVSTERTEIDEAHSKAPSTKKTLPKVQIKTSSKSAGKVQIKKRSQSGEKTESVNSSTKISPMKTRSASKVAVKVTKTEAKSKTESKKTVKAKATKSISDKAKSPIATRSLRKKK